MFFIIICIHLAFVFHFLKSVGGWKDKDMNEWEEINTKGAHLGKFYQRILRAKYDNTTTNPRRLECLRTPRILICHRKGRSPVLKTIRHISRKRKKVCHQAREGRVQIKHLLPSHLRLYTHLAGCINGEWLLNSVITAYSLIEKPSNKALMGQVSGEISPSPPSGRPWYSLNDYKRERSLWSGGWSILREEKREW